MLEVASRGTYPNSKIVGMAKMQLFRACLHRQMMLIPGTIESVQTTLYDHVQYILYDQGSGSERTVLSTYSWFSVP